MTETPNSSSREVADHVLHIVSIALMATGVLYGVVALAITGGIATLALPVFAAMLGAVLFVTNLIARRR